MSQVPTVRLSRGLEICRVLNGMWQVSGAHGTVDKATAVASMQAYVDAGLTTFDMADIYGPAEEIFGQFNSQGSPPQNVFRTLVWHEFLRRMLFLPQPSHFYLCSELAPRPLVAGRGNTWWHAI